MNRFKKFDPDKKLRKPNPENMRVGQVVKRKPCSRQRKSLLRVNMRKAIETKGMEFSELSHGDSYSIRRDK